ncbi:MAG: hypothetical protein Q9213_005556 [Squamulea squamosa]
MKRSIRRRSDKQGNVISSETIPHDIGNEAELIQRDLANGALHGTIVVDNILETHQELAKGQRQGRARGARLVQFVKKKFRHWRKAIGSGTQVNRLYPAVFGRANRSCDCKESKPQAQQEQISEYPLQNTTTTPSPTLSGNAGYPRKEESPKLLELDQQEISGHTQALEIQGRSGSSLPGRQDATSSGPDQHSLHILSNSMVGTNELGKEGSTLPSLVAAQREQPQGESSQSRMNPEAADAQAIGAKGSEELASGGATSSDVAAKPQSQKFKHAFRIVFHMAMDETAQRLACLDTGASVNLMSIDVVDSLNLRKDRYEGFPLRPMGGYCEPKWQVTVDWHVAKFHKTYTTTFVVMDETYSSDYDVLLGRPTIEIIGFYNVNNTIWFSTTEGNYCISKAIDAPDDSFPASEVQTDTSMAPLASRTEG